MFAGGVGNELATAFEYCEWENFVYPLLFCFGWKWHVHVHACIRYDGLQLENVLVYVHT